jgi:hypothetical protein
MLIYDVMLQESSEQAAIDHARGLVWSEVGQTEQPQPLHSHYVDTLNGIDVYYDYGADYYFFTDTEQV